MRKILFIFIGITVLILAIQCTSSYKKKKTFAEKYWGNERTCLPCHEYQQPIARNHNYRCDTCHKGDPYSTDKKEGHKDLIAIPQEGDNVKYACHRCHLLTLGKTVPYDSQFVQDVLMSHK